MTSFESHYYPADEQPVEAVVFDDEENIPSFEEEKPQITFFDETLDEEDYYVSPKELEHRRLIDQILYEAEIEKQSREMDAWWAANQDALKILAPKRSTSEQISEDEMQEELAKFRELLRADRREKERKEREHFEWRVSMVAEWFESHDGTAIKLDMDFETQWGIYCRESKQENEKKALAENEARRLQTLATAASVKAPAGWQGRRKGCGPNARGKVQGTMLKQKAKEAKIQAKKDKIQGKQSDYQGKRAKHRAAMEKHASEIKIIPREAVVAQIALEVEIDDEEDEQKKQEKEELAKQEQEAEAADMKDFLLTPSCSIATTVLPEDESDDEFAVRLLAAQGKESASSSVCSTPKPVVRAVPENCTRVGNKVVLSLKPQQTVRVRSEPSKTTPVKTVMCKFVLQGSVCRHGATCRYAHKPEELNRTPCKFGETCVLVHKVGDEFVPTGSKICTYWHPNESVASYAKRLKIPLSRAPTPAQTPAQTPVPTPVPTPAPTPKILPRAIPLPSQARTSPLRAKAKEFVPRVIPPPVLKTEPPKPEVVKTPEKTPVPAPVPAPVKTVPEVKEVAKPGKEVAKPGKEIESAEMVIQITEATMPMLETILKAVPAGVRVKIVYT